jgi:hypothetical protein
VFTWRADYYAAHQPQTLYPGWRRDGSFGGRCIAHLNAMENEPAVAATAAAMKKAFALVEPGDAE